MVKVTGVEAHARHLEAMAGPAMVAALGHVMFVGASAIAAEAKHSITEGSISGKGHIPSEPGQPPNADTRDLDSKIEAAQTGALTAEASSNSRHAVFMEIGTSRVAERPYMRPAAQKERAGILENVVAAVNAVNAQTKVSDGT